MTHSTWDIVVVGGANYDYMVRGPKLPTPGDAVEGTDFHSAAGGKGVNQAAAVARLGARVALVARVGNDQRGEAVFKRLADEGIETRYLVRDPEAPTGVVLVQIDSQGEKQTLSAPGAMNRLSVADVEAAADALRSARVVLMQLEVPVATVTAAARIAREGEARVFLDPSPPQPLPDELLQMVDVLKPNAGEAQVLTGIAVRDRDSAQEAAQRLLERGVQTVSIQAGNQGDLLVWRDGECWLPRFDVEAVDATGSGDAFFAALAVALLEGRSLEEVGPFASAAAALTTTAFGVDTSLPRRDAIHNLLARSA